MHQEGFSTGMLLIRQTHRCALPDGEGLAQDEPACERGADLTSSCPQDPGGRRRGGRGGYRMIGADLAHSGAMGLGELKAKRGHMPAARPHM